MLHKLALVGSLSLGFGRDVSTCSYSQTCSVNGVEGVCVSISSGCCSGGTVTSGLCSGSSDIKCCTSPTCTTPVGQGSCVQTSACGGQSYAGYCTGPADLQCCVSNDNDDSTEFGDSPYYYSHWCNAESYALPYLDDKYCQKKFPTSFDREWSCPVTYDSNHIQGYFKDQKLQSVSVDTTTLPSIITNGADLCIILTKRVNKVPYHKYYCNGQSSITGHETWSSSKIFAIANAAGNLHSECSSAGIDSTTTGKHGTTPLGDLATIVCSYDTTMGYSSNSLSSYFHDLGWRQRIHDLVTSTWLGQTSETLGGNYGESSPTDLGFKLTNSDKSTCSATKDPKMPSFSNTVSMLSASEMTRRITQYREIPAEFRFPNATWSDMKDIMYGAQSPILFPSVKWGGMTTDTSIYVQSSLDISDVQASSQGQWRIFSKLGAGYSSSRSVGEVISNAYACLPRLDANGLPIPNQGYEFTIAVRGSVAKDTSLAKADVIVYDAVKATISALLQGKL